MCDNTGDDGVCPRCSITPSQLCCDLCHPADFKNKFNVRLEKRKPQPRRSTMKPYEPSEGDRVLREQLNQWRWKMSDELFGERFTQNLGCFTFMPNDVFDCICNAAHYGLITSIETLAKETRWHLSNEHGQKVVDIVSEIQPMSTPQPPPQTSTTAMPKAKPRELTCTSCNQPGHSSGFFQWSSVQQQSDLNH